MQTELAGTGIKLLGVNQIGRESGNTAACDGRDLPWLQDDVDERAWDLWQVTYRDVIILDRENKPVAVFNLTENDLSVPSQYDALLALLRQTAGE